MQVTCACLYSSSLLTWLLANESYLGVIEFLLIVHRLLTIKSRATKYHIFTHLEATLICGKLLKIY